MLSVARTSLAGVARVANGTRIFQLFFLIYSRSEIRTSRFEGWIGVDAPLLISLYGEPSKYNKGLFFYDRQVCQRSYQSLEADAVERHIYGLIAIFDAAL
jgi:hypothetical protein